MMIVMVLLAASWSGHTIGSKAVTPHADTIFYRINTTIKDIEEEFWKQELQFLRDKKKKLNKTKCYIIVDETYDSYTGRLFRKLKKAIKKIIRGDTLDEKEKISKKDFETLDHIHKYKVKRGDTGSYMYVAIAIVYGNKRRILRIKSVKQYESYKEFIIRTLLVLQRKIRYECVLFDRGFYDGLFIRELKKHNIPFIVRARISETMKTIYGFYIQWKRYNDFEIGEHKVKGDLILGVDYTQRKRTKWAFITNMKFRRLKHVRELYRKRWNIENIFKATDGIQLRAQTNNPVTRLFCVCLSFMFYGAWQEKNKRENLKLLDVVIQLLENIFESIIRKLSNYRDKFKFEINFPFWKRITSSI